MTRAHIQVVITLPLDEAETLRKALKKMPKGKLDVLHNQLVDALDQAEQTLSGQTS